MRPGRSLGTVPRDSLSHQHLTVGGNGPGGHRCAAPRRLGWPGLQRDVQQFSGAQLPPRTAGLKATPPGPTSASHIVGEGLPTVVAGREVGSILPAVSVGVIS